MAQELPELFKHDESCALSLLELEASRLADDPKALAVRYEKRKDWPLIGGFLHLYWMISERLYDAGEKASARQLWEVIRDKGQAGSPKSNSPRPGWTRRKPSLKNCGSRLRPLAAGAAKAKAPRLRQIDKMTKR